MGKDNTSDLSEEQSQVEDISVQVQKAIKALPTLQQKVQAIAINGYLQQKKRLDDELQKQLALAQIKYFQLYAPFLTKINEIVEGTRELTQDDFEGVLGLLTEQQLDLKKNYLQPEKFKGYWNKVIINSPIGQQIKEKDQPILDHLYRIQASKNDTETNLTVKFYFTQNEWFTNPTLTKQFTLDGEEIVKSFGDVINWKEGKNITVKVVKKKQKNKKTGQKKTTSKQIKQQSFFHFFTQVDLQGEHEHDDDENDDEHNKQIEQLQNQYQIANTIFQELVPYSLEYYLGVGGGFGQQGLEGLEDVEQIEDQQEQEEVKPKKKKNKKGNKDDDAEDNKQKSKSKSKGKDKPSKGKQAKGSDQTKKQQCKQQ